MRVPPLLAGAAFLLAAALVAGAPGDAGAQAKQPTVVELFTSQGCNSCPPADAFLGELARREDVLALSLHIDYWDYLGWKDTFASPETTARQRAYGRTLSKRYIYTPQMVIGGVAEAVGSQRAKVERELEGVALGATNTVPVAVLEGHAGRIVVRIGKGESRGDAAVWLVRYDRRHEVPIARGENAGRNLTYYNVVRDIRRIGSWSGEAMEIALSGDALRHGGPDACAVLLQENGHGAILGAARIALDGT